MATLYHWADQVAQRIISQRGEKEVYTLASGITPSGTVHIGNFRELITVDFVKRALEKMGKKVRFIFSWDDYDVFRKVPKNMPKQEMLTGYLGKPIVHTPDPFDEEDSYARHHEKEMEESIKRVGIEPEFLYQAKKYQAGEYADQMKLTLDKNDEIKNILNKHRKEDLAESWIPVSIFCGKCHSNKMEFINSIGNGELEYKCSECSHQEKVVLKDTGLAKLLWRVDWPMRWSVEKVDFEPGGKDHSSEGGSFDTAKQISKTIFNHEPPIYQMYDFIRIKGKGGKISSSGGEVVTLDDVLEIYEPEIIRWIFSSYKTNVEFAISFDLDVLKIYEDFDRVERKYYGLEDVSEKQKGQITRAYELAQIDDVSPTPLYRASFRHLSNIMQINDFDFDKTKLFYNQEFKNDLDKEKFKTRFECVKNWIQKYAPEDFIFSINKEKINLEEFEIKKEDIYIIQKLRELLLKDLEEQETNQQFYDFLKENELDLSAAFKHIYFCLINKPKGPKLIPFIYTIGLDKVIPLLDF